MSHKTRISKDLDQRTLTVERVFDAPLDRVWRAYTDPELLEQWWAPLPWKTETLRMQFAVGGDWFYAMNGPDGERQCCRMDFLDIQPGKSFTSDDFFTDANGEINLEMPKQKFTTTFTAEANATRVIVVADYERVEDLETVIEMGIEQGITLAQDQLAALLAAGG
jgi:uncharacterized protein YndB with AHSA1/START domain